MKQLFVHPWHHAENGDITHSNEEDPVHGWSAYLREDLPGDEPFHIPWDEDYPTMGEALAGARDKARELGLDPEDIEVY